MKEIRILGSRSNTHAHRAQLESWKCRANTQTQIAFMRFRKEIEKKCGKMPLNLNFKQTLRQKQVIKNTIFL